MAFVCPENYNSSPLVEMWTGFIDWEKRRIGENGFLVKQLKAFNCRKVFDACSGDGADSIYLIKQGFEVTSNDLDKLFVKKALENAKKANVSLNVTGFDWGSLDRHFRQESFDAVLCLGNSLTYLFKREEQVKALKNFLFILRKGGILIVDERNYEYLLKQKKEILEKGNFKYSKKYVYCGEKVHGEPIEISKDRVKMQYTNEETGKKAWLELYPFKKNELLGLLKEAGFTKIERFSDYKKGQNKKADFYQYVCVK